MNYIDQFISEQTERNILAGYNKNIALEYHIAKTTRYETYDDDELDNIMDKIIHLVAKGHSNTARLVFDELSSMIKEGQDPDIKENVWKFILDIASDLKKYD